MKNEQSAARTLTAHAQTDLVDKINDGNNEPPDLNTDEKAVQFKTCSLSATKSLPTNGENIKVIVSDGTMTLRGFVKSEQEKVSIGAMARQYANGKHIDNQLEVID